MSIIGKVFSLIVSAIKSRLQGPMTKEQVERDLDAAAAANPEKLDWRHSIVDLLKLLKLPSDLETRKDLAEDLGYEGELDGSAEMNLWLIEKTLQRVADHYVTVPGQTNEKK